MNDSALLQVGRHGGWFLLKQSYGNCVALTGGSPRRVVLVETVIRRLCRSFLLKQSHGDCVDLSGGSRRRVVLVDTAIRRLCRYACSFMQSFTLSIVAYATCRGGGYAGHKNNFGSFDSAGVYVGRVPGG